MHVIIIQGRSEMIEVAQNIREVMRRDRLSRKSSWSKRYLVKPLEVTGASQN